MARHKVVIIGGGFGGLYAAQAFKHQRDVEVTLIDRRNFHLFQPLLYQVATGGLSPGDIASPLRAVLKHHKNVKTLMGEVVDIDVARREVVLRDDTAPYDTLIVATGVTHSYFGNNQWSQNAPGLKTIEDAIEMRRKIFFAFEGAERQDDQDETRAWMNFVIVGGGPTGVELAGALAELAQHTLKRDFRSIDSGKVNIFLVDGADRVLPSYHEDLSEDAEGHLRNLGVTVKTSTVVTNIDDDKVTMKHNGREETLRAKTVLWAAGVQASPLGRILADRATASLDRIGRVMVDENLSIPNHPEIMVIGDLAHCIGKDGSPLAGVAPVAMQQGAYAAKLVERRMSDRKMKPFQYFDKGNMAVIGRNAAVADIHGVHVKGLLAWIMWLFVHILYLVEYDNRLLVATQWAWNYFTRNRGARLVTHQNDLSLKKKPIGQNEMKYAE